MEPQNTYTKFCPNVFVAKCPEQHEAGEVIILTTKYGKEHENEVHNYLGKSRDGFFLYSITRCDGVNAQERAKKKAERLNGYKQNAEKRSAQHYEDSKEGSDFLRLGEPIKVGHHSEKRHRALIDKNWARIGKSIDEDKKADEYSRRVKYWEAKAEEVNLSMPESLEYFEFKLEEAKKAHQFFKDTPDQRPHSMSLKYANKNVKETEKNLALAVRLWGDAKVIQQLNAEKEEEAKKKALKGKKGDKLNNFIQEYGGFFFFGSDVNAFRQKYNELLYSGIIEEGEKVTHIMAGLYIPVKHKEQFFKLV